MRKPMEHANMCSKLSVLDQGRIKTCASLSRPLQVTVRSILQQTFREIILQLQSPDISLQDKSWENVSEK